MKFYLYSFILLSFYSCKTAEEIAREKKFDEMTVQVVEHQKQILDFNFKSQEMESRLNQIYGAMEELKYEEKQEIVKKEQERVRTLTEVTERLNLMEGKLTKIEDQLKAQGEFIQKVTKSLSGIKKTTSKKVKSGNDVIYEKAMKAYNNKQYKTAKTNFIKLLEDPKTNAVRKVRGWFTLGNIYFKEKNYQEAMVFFSKVYANYPKSSKSPSSLLFIAKSFAATGEKEDAKGSLNQIIKQYSNSREAKEAKKILDSL